MNTSLYPAQLLRQRVLAWALKLRVNPRVVRIQKMRRKWGSCSVAGTVTLAADLVRQNSHFQDYVVVHELLHLRYPNHGRMFTALMSAHLPGWRRWSETHARKAPTKNQLMSRAPRGYHDTITRTGEDFVTNDFHAKAFVENGND